MANFLTDVTPITVTVEGKEVFTYINGLKEKIPNTMHHMGYNIAEIIASATREAAWIGGSFGNPSGKLGRSVHAEMIEKGSSYGVIADAENIHGNPYWYYSAHGRRSGRAPPAQAVEAWARRIGVNPYALAKSIAAKGTTMDSPNFIEEGMNRAMSRIDAYIEREIERLIK